MKKRRKRTIQPKTKSILCLLLIALITAGCIFTTAVGIGKQHKGIAKHIDLGLDLAGGVSITYEVNEKNPSNKDMDDTVYKLERRVEHYSTESEVYREGKNRITIEIPGVTDANKILEELGKPGNLAFMTQDGTTVLTGANIKNAQAQTTEEQGMNSYVVSLSMDSEGAKKFAEATQNNIGKPIYIIYDNEVVSSPTVQSAITDGQCVIEGMKDYDAADKLASTIRIGALPLTLKELRSNVVGAKLGQNAIKTSLTAGIIALLIIWLFMTIIYRLPGFLSGVSLLGYVLLNLLALNGFDVTMTLPGIAGILLAIGMAVDANVIIFTRIKEEIANGKPVETAINLGHHKASSAIIDGNVTTIIAAIILYWKGSGSVRGFAQTLGIGVILSMFMALVVTKILVEAFYNFGCKDEKLYGKQKTPKEIDFIRYSKIMIPIAVICISIGLIFLPINQQRIGNPLNYDLEFSGGTAITMTMEEKPTKEMEENIKKTVQKTVHAKSQTQKIMSSNQIVVKTKELSVEQRKTLEKELKKDYKIKEYEPEEIAASISSEMRKDAVIAVMISIIFMLLYIAIRFKSIHFGSSAIIALAHDVLIVFALYSVARLSVGNTFIACMLTILGYSINATIVIFDRIRENNRKGRDLREVVNSSISQTLSRSINTTFTSFVPIFLLFLIGVPAIKEFTLSLICGVICGCLSSIFLTGPIWYYLETRKNKKK